MGLRLSLFLICEKLIMQPTESIEYIQHIEYTVLKTVYILAGVFIINLGYKLFIKGVNGEASLKIEYEKSKAQLANAAPGIFFALGGILIIIFAICFELK